MEGGLFYLRNSACQGLRCNHFAASKTHSGMSKIDVTIFSVSCIIEGETRDAPLLWSEHTAIY